MSFSYAAKDCAILEALRAHGFAKVKGVLSTNIVQEFRKEVQDVETAVLALGPVDAGQLQNILNPRLNIIYAPENRHDVLLPLSECVLDVLESIAQALGPVLRSVLGPGALLVEGPSAVTAHPQADRQTVHQDVDTTADIAWSYGMGMALGEEEFQGVNMDAAARILTVFVALQDVTDDMGPTEIFPGTHSIEVAEQIAKRRRLHGKEAVYREWQQGFDQLFGWKAEKMVLSAGDAVILDARTFHCGGANRSQTPRTLFHCSWVSKYGERPLDFTYHCMESTKLCLDDFPLSPQHKEAVSERSCGRQSLPARPTLQDMVRVSHMLKAMQRDEEKREIRSCAFISSSPKRSVHQEVLNIPGSKRPKTTGSAREVVSILSESGEAYKQDVAADPVLVQRLEKATDLRGIQDVDQAKAHKQACQRAAAALLGLDVSEYSSTA